MAFKNIRFKLDAAIEKTSQGFARIPVYCTRVGVFTYSTPDGKVRREFRPPEEVFHPDSIASLSAAPITHEHPTELVGPDNSKELMVGFLSENVQTVQETYLQSTAILTDALAISMVERREKQEVSCGYECEQDETPGEWNGMPYDLVQRKIRYNHLAITSRGRAGHEVKFRMDSDLEMSEDEIKKEKPKMKVTINGKEYDVADDVGAAIVKLQEEMKAMGEKENAEEKAALEDAKEAKEKVGEMSKELEKSEAKADSLAAELKKLKATKTDSVDVKALLKERRQLEMVADSVGVEKYEDMEPADLKKAVIKADSADANLEGKSEAYIDARFELIAEKFAGSSERADSIGKKLNDKKTVQDSAARRADAMKKAKELSSQPLSVQNK